MQRRSPDLASAQPSPSLTPTSPTPTSRPPPQQAEGQPTGSDKSQVRRQANMSKERARTSAHHVRPPKPQTLTP